MKKLIVVLVVVIVVGGAYYLMSNTSSKGTPTYTPLPTEQSSTIPTETPVVSVSITPETSVTSNVTIEIKNFAFNPSLLTVKKGTKVTWVNNDSAPHAVNSDSGNLLNSGTIAPGQSFSFTFNGIGTTAYHCSLHPTMKGSIVVTK